MALPSLPFARFTSSRQLLPGSRENDVADLLTSFQGNIVALAGGARTGSPVLNATFCELTSVVTGSDSVQLPVAKVGLSVTVTNSGGNAAQVFANGTDTINGTAGTTGANLANNTTALFECTKNCVLKHYVSA